MHELASEDESELLQSGTIDSIVERPTSRPSGSDEASMMRLYDDELIASGATSRSTVPPSSDLTSLDAPLVLPEHAFFQRLDDLARRMEMLTALLQVDGLSRAQGSRAIQAALRAIAANAEEANVSSLGSLARALQHAVGELLPHATVDTRTLDVLVLDESEISRDFVSLAVEAQGHIVRSAATYDEFVELLGERLPDLIVTEVAHGRTPPRQFCSVLADLLDTYPTRLVVFSSLPAAELALLKKISGATAVISKDLGLPALVAELAHLLKDPSLPPQPGWPRQRP